jgi:hypothetical protein
MLGCLALGVRAEPLKMEIAKPLSASDLFGGLEARKVLLDAVSGRVVLDARVFKHGKEKQGVLVTDPIDLGGREGVISLPTTIERVRVNADLQTPGTSTAKVEVRTGAQFFDQTGWSPWGDLGEGGVLKKVSGRYAQLRITLASQDAAALPSVGNVLIQTQGAVDRSRLAGMTVANARIQQIVRSPIVFYYERPDHEKIVKFRKAVNLDAVVAPGTNDFDKLVRLMDWVGGCKNVRGLKRHYTNGYYAWDIDLVTEVTEASTAPDKIGQASIHGHCMSYAEVLSIAATALGFKSRHYAIAGFREMSHEVCEIWVPSLGKWVYFDPSLTNYYLDPATGAPLNIVEMHRIVVDHFVPDGKDMNWLIQRRSDETYAVVRKVGGQKPIRSRLGPRKYGEPMPADYDWGWHHGYLAAGFLQMTPRTDFHTNPSANPKRFEHMPGYAGYPFWVDEKTPPIKSVNTWYTRMRDFYWTLDQASLVLSADAQEPNVLLVEFGNSMPFFKGYRVEVNGQTVAQAVTPFLWKLQPGENRLQVTPVDDFGQTGQASSVTVTRP